MLCFNDLQIGDYFYTRGSNKLMRKVSVDTCYSFVDNKIIHMTYHKKLAEKLKVSIKIERIEE